MKKARNDGENTSEGISADLTDQDNCYKLQERGNGKDRNVKDDHEQMEQGKQRTGNKKKEIDGQTRGALGYANRENELMDRQDGGDGAEKAQETLKDIIEQTATTGEGCVLLNHIVENGK
ncbi:hypothetical protein CHS0354_006321 [Potamilus streckersoni]|uniref:Uncharacterized protein n=1 Tax=Potamilus streckersoni TaxID=2493646 RepID=A0AAE0VNZ9_9BIVA|nr:hypothetical protein CHS0354_006321 [Potamilus streckersoni]